VIFKPKLVSWVSLVSARPDKASVGRKVQAAAILKNPLMAFTSEE
jgi:hypothetical protein